jgi:adenylosuccinate synthase
MRARAVIGANFGDEGKGLVVDYLCQTGGEVVVRFNGGAQAGHTVVTPEGLRHVFGHFGSGTLYGVPTFLSQFFVVNPVAFFREHAQLEAMGVTAQVFAHPDCLVTTHADMIINQRKESKRGPKAHGSCGLGVHETMQRSQVPHLKITMSDLWNRAGSLRGKVEEICEKYAAYRTGSPIRETVMAEVFLKECEAIADLIPPAGIGQCKDPIFEGAQGLLLDQDRKEYHPHVTHSSTGMKNVRILCAQAGIDEVTPYYVSRTYLTRHGAGPLPGEDPKLVYDDTTNLPHPWQGRLRFAPLDYTQLMRRCGADADGTTYRTAFTHCDQLAPKSTADLYSYGPTRANVRSWKDVEKAKKRMN